MLRLANKIHQSIIFRFCKGERLFLARAFKIKYNAAKKKLIANPSKAPPFSNWTILKNENLDNPIIRLKKNEKNNDPKNKCNISANMNVLIV